MVTFSPVTESHLDTVREIYDYYILNTTATFHDQPISLPELKEFLYLDSPRYPSFVIENKGDIIGYCFLTRYKKRQAYDRTAEVSIYLRPEYTNRGIGRACLEYLENAARMAGIQVLVGTLCGENQASIRLMEKAGYSRCAHLHHVGEKFGRVLDVVMYQKELSG